MATGLNHGGTEGTEMLLIRCWFARRALTEAASLGDFQ